MRARTLRLILATVLFTVWLGWLIYLTVTTARPIVLSRPQFLISQLDVVAALPKPAGPSSEVIIKEALWPKDQIGLQGKSITIENLAQCDGFGGQGDYILPLTRDGDRYRVTPVPPSPSFAGSSRSRIYPLTRQTRWQLDQILKPK